MKKFLVFLCAISVIFGVSAIAKAVPVVDVIDTPQPPFMDYRWYNEDWGWEHNPIIDTITSGATLNISAYDVDWDDPDFPEIDIISVYENVADAYVDIGSLTGVGSTWSYTTFVLDSMFYDDIANGLQVHIDIDSTHTENYWAVTIAKSVLEINGGQIPGPEPGASVPEPATVLLFGSGLIGLAGFTRRFRKK